MLAKLKAAWAAKAIIVALAGGLAVSGAKRIALGPPSPRTSVPHRAAPAPPKRPVPASVMPVPIDSAPPPVDDESVGDEAPAPAAASAFTVTIGRAAGGLMRPTQPASAAAVVVEVPVTVRNTDGDARSIGSLAFEITPGWTDALPGHPDCSAADFSIDGLAAGSAHTVVLDRELASGAELTRTFDLQMVDTGRDQDACAGARPSLTATAAQSR